MKRGWEKLLDRPWLLALILVVVLVIPGFLRVQQIANKTDDVVACINDWADRTAIRSSALAAANADKNTALDALLRAAAAGDVAALRTDLTTYVTASDRFNAVVKANPVPQSPKLTC